MLIVGLTGSMAMGKSTAADRIQSAGIAIFSADAAVHDLYAGAAASLVEQAFPGSTVDGQVDRAKLVRVLAGKPENYARLEAIIHPMVREAEKQFLKYHQAQNTPIVVMEIPLLFETGFDQLVDVIITVTTTPEIQKQRAFERPGMTEEKFTAILSRQLPDQEKRQRSDFVVDTSGPKSQTAAAIDILINDLRRRQGIAIEKWK